MSEVFDEDMENVNDEDVITSDDTIDDVIVLQENELKVGLGFKSEESAVQAIMLWSEKTFCPLSKSRYRKPKVKPSGERVKGRRCFQCCHGLKYTRKVTDKRPWQKIKYTECPVKVNMNEQEDGSWMVTSLVLDHIGHPVTKTDFYSHQVARKLEPEDKEFVKELLKARANPKNIANVITERKGVHYNAQDVRNIVARIKTSEEV